MISFLVALSGDIFAVIIFVRGFKLITKPQHKMTETSSDYASRRFLGYLVCGVGVAAVLANHFLFKF